MSAHLQTAFDIALVPEQLSAEDPLDQREAYLGAITNGPDSRDEALRAFRVAPRSDIDLLDLQRVFEGKHKSVAMRMLQSRRRVTYGQKHVADADPQTMFWDTDASYLDMLVCVGRGTGLAPVIPCLDSHHSFVFRVDLSESHRAFTTKHVKLGFDRTGSMMWIGRTGAGEDAWLAFVKRDDMDMDVTEDGANTLPNPNRVGSSCLTAHQQRRAKMFLAHCVLCIHFRDITVGIPYPDVEDEMDFNSATNIFDRYLDMNLQDLKEFDNAITTEYGQWVGSSPASYRDDNFFTSRIPICVTSRFGQNHRIGVNAAQERRTWDADRDWSRIRYVNIALATHVRVHHINNWNSPQVGDLRAAYPQGIFDSADISSRNELTDVQLQEILNADVASVFPRVYNARGYVIDTHDPELDSGVEPYGVLIKAAHLQHAFAPLPAPAIVAHPMQVDAGTPPLDDIPPIDAPPTATTPFTFYPQAGLRTVGHFQASGLFSTCYPIVGRLNQRIRGQNLTIPDHNVGGEDEIGYISRNRRVVEPISSQGYNAIMHHTRGRSAQHHDAQLGLVTAALAGQWVSPSSSYSYRSQARDCLSQCQYEMPHESFNAKIHPTELSRDLRLENVYCLDLTALHPSRRSGSVIIDKIIKPLLRIWDHASTRETIENHVLLFHPSAYPAVYSWTTYPLTCLLDHIFAQAQEVYSTAKFTHALLVELCSVVERALNYMHTGNAAVIATSLMTPLWIGKALVTDGFPCFNSDMVVILSGNDLTIPPVNWPLAPGSARPLSSSKATQLFRYDRKQFNVFYAHLAMGIVVAKPPPPFVKESDELRQRAFAIMAYCVALFIDDCKDFVTVEVSKDIKRQRLLPLPQSRYAELRSAALKRWKAVNTPLSYGGKKATTFATLLSCVSDNPHGEAPDSTVDESLSYCDLAKHMIGATRPSRSVPAPLWKNGSCLAALEIAIPEVQLLLNISEPDTGGVVADILAITLRDLDIHFVPWHAPSRSTRGTSHIVSHLYWMSIDRANQVGAEPTTLPVAVVPMSQIQQVAVDRILNDPSSPWCVPVKLSQMGSFWDKTVLPEDWSLGNANINHIRKMASHKYVVDTYEWAQANYNKDNWRHHMALVWSILLTAVLPRLHIPDELKDDARNERSLSGLNQTIRSWDWQAPKGTKKGLTKREPFITIVTTVIMALLDKRSPLRKGMEERNGWGGPWTTKHGAKYIHTLNLIRIGILEATGFGAVTTAKFGENFNIHPEDQLKNMYERVLTCLRHEEYGVYFAACELFGLKMAQTIVSEGHGKMPMLHSSQSQNA